MNCCEVIRNTNVTCNYDLDTSGCMYITLIISYNLVFIIENFKITSVSHNLADTCVEVSLNSV